MGTPELPNACQGPPKQYENLGNSMVLARRPFSRSGRFSRSFGQAWTTLDPNWRPGGPLAGPAERQNGGESHSWGQALTNLSTQSSAVDLHAQLNLRICYTWPSSWLRFLRFCANRMAWLWSGKETVKPHWSNFQMLSRQPRAGLASLASEQNL